MKIIDQTPLLDANGQLSLVNRVQGMLKYGFSWPASLEAQNKVIAQLNKAIEKGYTLIRNQKLGASEIIVPLILIGPSGIYVIEATPLKGLYRARGEELGTISNGRLQPVSVNIITRTLQLAKALQVFFERQGIKLPAPVEPVLLAADPGLHIESVRPAVRIVLSDAINIFSDSVLKGRLIYNTQEVGEFVERIQGQHSAQQAPEPLRDDPFAFKEVKPSPKEVKPSLAAGRSRMKSILTSPQSDRLIDTGQSDVDFAFGDERSPTVLVSNPAPTKGGKPRSAAPAKKRIIGMLPWQIALLAGIFLFWCAGITAVLVYIFFLATP
jgi:hypothetical protein